jgi:hypothetical protein
MTLGTADENGRPWVSPVYYAPESYAKFYWVSSPEATRSRNLAARPEVSIVIFDSRTPVGSGQGVYMSAVAEELTDTDLDRCIAIFSHRSETHGAGEWTSEDVRLPARARLRLYRAAALEHSVLGPQDRRIPVSCRAMTRERLPRLPQAREIIKVSMGTGVASCVTYSLVCASGLPLRICELCLCGTSSRKVSLSAKQERKKLRPTHAVPR